MPSADVVIVGAGAAGCATAYFLTQLGVRPVIVERDAIADHASGFAFGGLTAFGASGRPGAEYPLLRRSMALHERLASELKAATGIDTGFERLPFFALAGDEQDRARVLDNLPWLNSEGYPAEWLDGDQVRQLDPRFSPDLLGAVRVEGAGLVESYRYTLALAQAAEKAGAEIRHGEAVGMRVENGRITGLQTRRDTIACGQVVIATGPWTGPASEWLGMAVPIRPLKGQIVRLRLPDSGLVGRFAWRHSYFATKADGLIWAGTTEEEAGFDERTTTEARDEIITSLANLFPPLLDAEIVQQTACLRPVAPDWLPIVGEAPGLPGLFVVTGGARRGILLSAGMGEAAADLVVGRAPTVDLSAYSLARFAERVAG